MAVYKCKNCGEDVVIKNGEMSAKCAYCGYVLNVPGKNGVADGSVSSGDKKDPSNAIAGEDPILRRAFLFLEDGKWEEADEYCERMLDQDPENAHAYLGKLMADMKAAKPEYLASSLQPLETNDNYRKIIRFGDEELVKKVTEYNKAVVTRIGSMNGSYYGAPVKPSAPNSGTVAAAAGDSADKMRLFGKIASMALAALLLLFLLVPTVWAGVMHLSLLNVDIVFSDMVDIFMTIAAVAAFIAILMFLAYVILQLMQLKSEEETPLLKAVRLIFYCVCAITVIFLFIAVKDMDGRLGGAGAIQLESAWYFAAVLCIVGLILSLKSALLNNKTALIVLAVLIGVCLILFFIFCLGTFSAANDAASAANDIRNGIISDITSQLPDMNAGNGYNNSGNGGNGSSGGNGGGNGGGNVNNGTVSVGDYTGKQYNDLISALSVDNLMLGTVTYVPSDKPYGTVISQYPSAFSYVAAGTTVNVTISDGSLSVVYTVGGTVTLGSYEQDNNYNNGKEPIEWIVLSINKGSALLVSKYGLDSRPYNSYGGSTTWEQSSLREWMNGTFLNTAFNASEQAKIESRKMPAYKNPQYSTNPGKDTYDKVFTLSIDAAKKYFNSDSARKCKPTDYALANGASTSGAYCWWWLRPPGYDSYLATCIDCNGSIYYNGYDVSYGDLCVRPAIWVTI